MPLPYIAILAIIDLPKGHGKQLSCKNQHPSNNANSQLLAQRNKEYTRLGEFLGIPFHEQNDGACCPQ